MEIWRFISEAEDAEERCRATIAENAVLAEGCRLFYDHVAGAGLGGQKAFIALDGLLGHYLDRDNTLGSQLAMITIFEVDGCVEALHTAVLMALEKEGPEKEAVLDAAIEAALKQGDEEIAFALAAWLSKGGEGSYAERLFDGARSLGIEIDPLLLPEQDVAEGGFDPDDELVVDWDDAFENARIEVEGCFGEDWAGRKPERIPGFLAELGDLWAKHCPDWRFGQLACNLDRFHRYRNGDADLFYLEEYEFLALMKDFFDTLSPSDQRE